MTNEQPGATTGYVDVPGGRLYYEVAGQGQPILFNHADVSDHSMWDEQVAAFAPNYRVITYDKRGFGKTTSEDGAYSPREDIVALLAHLGVARSFVVGLSNGGAQALDFTLEHPEMVDGLVVVAGGVSGYEATPTEDELRSSRPMRSSRRARMRRDWSISAFMSGATARSSRRVARRNPCASASVRR